MVVKTGVSQFRSFCLYGFYLFPQETSCFSFRFRQFMMEEDEFKVVVRPKRRQKFSKSKHLDSQKVGPVSEEERTQTQDETKTSFSVEYVLKTLRDCSEEIKLTTFYETFEDLLLMNLYHGSKCGLHKTPLTCNNQKDPIPFSITESTADTQKISPSSLEEENSPESLKHTPSSIIDPRQLTNEESDEPLKIIPPQIENLESLSSTLSSDETGSCRLLSLEADHCKALTNLELVIYGIGNFAECLIARYQLALMLALRDTLKLPDDRVLVFDPRLSLVERSTIKELGLSLISTNEEGKRTGTDKHRTLFFMPHCGKALCNNLLWANWKPSQLSNIVIIGNSFSSVVERSPERLLKKYYYYIWKIHSITAETRLPDYSKHSDVFNDTSIHSFRSVDLLKLPEDFWTEHTEPVYDSSDLEIIVNK